MEKYKIKYLSDALIDREEIKNYLAKYYESTVRDFFTLLKKNTSRLKEFPYSCPIYEDDPDYRCLIVGDYIVFYIVNEDDKTVEIYRILHGSRDMKRYLA
jgi:addiction module RelE/StbE family toxin